MEAAGGDPPPVTKDGLIRNHFTIFCVRKKKKEKKNIVVETVRDYKNFNKESFCNLLSNIDWKFF